MTKADIARKFRKDNPKMATLKLARILYEQNNILFKSIEDARERLRYIEGKSSKNKAVCKGEFFKAEPRPYNPYKLPESDAVDIKPYVLRGYKRAFIINDVHIPFHSLEAITIAFDYAKKEKPDVVILNGDIIDAYQLSRFLRDPKERHFAQELQLFKQFFEIVKKTFNCPIIYKLANHEIRYEHFLFQKAKELDGIDEFKLENIIKARAEGVIVVDDKRIIKLNDLDLLHGHEFQTGFFNPVNVARGLYLRAKVTAMQGHSHRSSSHTETDLHGKIKTTWSVGCLCHLSPKYAPYNSWNWGFALVDMSDNKKEFVVRNKTIYEGKVF